MAAWNCKPANLDVSAPGTAWVWFILESYTGVRAVTIALSIDYLKPKPIW